MSDTVEIDVKTLEALVAFIDALEEGTEPPEIEEFWPGNGGWGDFNTRGWMIEPSLLSDGWRYRLKEEKPAQPKEPRKWTAVVFDGALLHTEPEWTEEELKQMYRNSEDIITVVEEL